MSTIEDKEFGSITVRKAANSNSMRASVAPNGTLRVTVPSYAPLFMVKRMISGARSDLRALLDARPSIVIENGRPIGKSHSMIVRSGAARSIKRTGQQLIVTLAPSDELNDPTLINSVRSHMISILRREAKHHLPKRISFLAEKHGYTYSTLRFTHASSRWGSCNSNKAISLNIALMGLPFELIDYVLIHELSHTIHLNHSHDFWKEVGRGDPDYKSHKTELKNFNPNI